MKLNPPGSSSDLEVARGIARRLHQRAFGGDVPAETRPDSVVPPAPRPATAPPVPFTARPSPPRRPIPPPLPAPPVPRARFEPAASPVEPPTSEPWAEEAPEGGSEEPREGREPWAERPAEPRVALWDSDDGSTGAAETPEGEADSALGELDADVEPDDALAELTDPASSTLEPEVPGAPEPSFAGGGAPEVSPEDLFGSPPGAPEGWTGSLPPGVDIETIEDSGTSPEDLIEVAAPSWDDVADTCMALASSRGAMLVDASGQILAARGDWPNPGAEAIAGRLIKMMERALRDAPTRSVSAPLAGQHLTAWRVPLGESVLTAVFMGDAPLRADVRPPIDDQIRQAAGV